MGEFCSVFVKGKHHRILCRPEDTNQPSYTQFWQRLNNGDFFSGLYCRVNQHGQVVWLRATYNPVFDERGQLLKIIKFATDVTVQVEQQQAESAVKHMQSSREKVEHGVQMAQEAGQAITDIRSGATQAVEAIRQFRSTIDN